METTPVAPPRKNPPLIYGLIVAVIAIVWAGYVYTNDWTAQPLETEEMTPKTSLERTYQEVPTGAETRDQSPGRNDILDVTGE